MTDFDDTAPPASLDAVVRALQSPSRADELEGADAMVEAMAAAVVAADLEEIPTMPARSRSLKVAVLAGAAVLSLAGVAAATTGLPNRPSRPTPVTATSVEESSTSSASSTDPSAVADETTTTATTEEPTTAATTDATTTTTGGDGGTPSDEVAAPPCPPGVTNHGEYVSKVARETPPGPEHGHIVSAAARSDCGKRGDETGGGASTTDPKGDDSAGTRGGQGKAGDHGNGWGSGSSKGGSNGATNGSSKGGSGGGHGNGGNPGSGGRGRSG